MRRAKRMDTVVDNDSMQRRHSSARSFAAHAQTDRIAMAETKMYGVRFLPVLLVIALVCVAAAAGLLAFGGQDADAGASSVRQIERAARAVAEDPGAGAARR